MAEVLPEGKFCWGTIPYHFSSVAMCRTLPEYCIVAADDVRIRSAETKEDYDMVVTTIGSL